MSEFMRTPPGAENFKAPTEGEKPLFGEDDLDMDQLFGEAKSGEMLQAGEAEDLEKKVGEPENNQE